MGIVLPNDLEVSKGKEIDKSTIVRTMFCMRLLLLMGASLTFFVNLGVLYAQDEDPAKLSKASLVSEVTQAKPGSTVWLGLRFEVEAHWHLGWAVAGDAGLPTEVKWSVPDDVTVGDLHFPVPARFEYEGFVSYVHEGTFLVLVPLSIPDDWEKGKEVEVTAEVSWSVCNETNCFPLDRKISLSLVTGEATAYDNSQKPIFAKARKSLPISQPDTVQASAYVGEKEIILRLSGDGLSETDPGNFYFFSRDEVVAPAGSQNFSLENETYVLRMARAEFSDVPERFRGILSTSDSLPGGAKAWEIDLATKGKTFGRASGTLPHVGQSNDSSDTGSPSVVRVDGNQSAALTPLIWREWSTELVRELQEKGRPVYVDFTAKWCLSCQVNKRIYSNDKVLRKMNELGVVALKADWTNKDPVILEALQAFGREGVPLNVFYPKDRSGLTDGILLPAVLTVTNVLDALEGKEAKEDPLGFGGVLAYAFFGGLILNLMPCVFPVIGLKIMSFTKLAGEEPSEVVKHGAVFTIGVVLSFWILAGALLALRAAGEQLGWGFQMQEPGFVYLMAMLLLLLGLSLSGVFEVGLSMTGAGSELSDKAGFTGTFFSGALAVVVATPCMAPFLGAAVGAALSLEFSTIQSLLVFTFVAFGLSGPYLFLSAFPRMISFLPKPGAWMETFKQFMAFPLYATVAWLLWTLYRQLPVEGFSSLWVSFGLVMAALGAWVYGRWGASHLPRQQRSRAMIFALALVILGAWGGWPSQTVDTKASAALASE